MPEQIAALLLDLDGTLVDSEQYHREVFRSWFAGRGWPVSEATLAGFTGRRADDVFAAEDGPWRGEDPAAMTAELLAHVVDLPSPPLAAGALDLLGLTSVRLALVTSANTEWARTCLGDLLDRFEVIVTRDEVTRGKPDPEPYTLAASILGLPPERCLAVEDAPAGVASAVAAGIGVVVGVTSTFTPLQLVEAHRVVSGLDEVRALLGS